MPPMVKTTSGPVLATEHAMALSPRAPIAALMRDATDVGKRIPEVPVSERPILTGEELVSLPVMESLERGEGPVRTETVAVEMSKNQPM